MVKNYLVLKYYILVLLVHPYVSYQCIRPNVAFSINFLVRYNYAPTQRYWNGIKHILCYLCRITNVSILFENIKLVVAWIYKYF